MADHTDFAGFTVLGPGEPLSADSFSFQALNPVIADRLLKMALLSHKHDGHAALANPAVPPSAVAVDTGGTIPADTTITIGYTITDAVGGETELSDVDTVTTQAGIAAPDDVPTAVVDHASGTLVLGNYYYGITVTDGLGGETTIGPAVAVTIDPGSPNNRILISGLASLVAAAGGVGWRMWRSVNGGAFYLLDDGTTDTLTDDGTLCLDCTMTPPESASGTTNSTTKLQVTVPSGQPAEAVSFSIYATVTGEFQTPSLLGTYPIADTGSVKEYASLALLPGAPPLVTQAMPGANKIDALTDLVNLSIKASVANAAALPAAGNVDNDMRVTRDDYTWHVYYGGAWHSVGGGGGGHTLADEGTSQPARAVLDVIGSRARLLDATGNEFQAVEVLVCEAGAFKLSFGANQTPTTISASASAATVQTALEGTTGIGAGNVAVTGPNGGPWTVEFKGALANTNVAQLGVVNDPDGYMLDIRVRTIMANGGAARSALLVPGDEARIVVGSGGSAPAFGAGWAESIYAEFEANVCFWLSADGHVGMEGWAHSTSAPAYPDTRIFTLPYGYRPKGTKRLPCISVDDSSALGKPGALLVLANGEVHWDNGVVGTNWYLSLDGIRFRAR